MFDNIINENVLNDMTLEELQQLEYILKDIPPYYDIKEAEKIAKSRYDAYVDNFEPIVAEFNQDNDGVSFLIKDANSPTQFWVDAYVSSYDGMIVIDYNQYIFDLHNPNDVYLKMLQDNSDVFEAVYYAVCDYNSSHGLLEEGV